MESNNQNPSQDDTIEALFTLPPSVRNPQCVWDAIQELQFRGCEYGRVVSIDGKTISAQSYWDLGEDDRNDIQYFRVSAEQRGGKCDLFTDRHSVMWWIASFPLRDGRIVTIVEPVRKD